MDSNGSDNLDHGEQFLEQLSLDEKLKIATETLITGKLKDNHDDTLFCKFCSLLKTHINTENLLNFVTKQNVFKLIHTNLPNFEGANFVGKQREDIVAFFRITGALFSREEAFNYYLDNNKNIFDITQILCQVFPLSLDNTCEDPKLLVFTLLSFIKNISSHKSGAQWLLAFWFDASNENESRFVMEFIPFMKSENTHYIQKEVYFILGQLIDQK